MQAPTFPQRPARSLIGWLSIGDGGLSLSGHRKDQQPSAEMIGRCDAARQAVASRPAGVDQTGLFHDMPVDVAEHVATLRTDPSTASILVDAGEPRMVDLTRVRAVRSEIHIEDARRRVKGVGADDVLEVARITLPLP